MVLQSRTGDEGVGNFDALINFLGVSIQMPDTAELPVIHDAFLRYGKGSGSGAQLNMGDPFSYALAKGRDIPLLFKGDDFRRTDIRPALPA